MESLSWNGNGNGVSNLKPFKIDQDAHFVSVNEIFDNVFKFISERKDFIEAAAGLHGGWEGWLQAALAVYLRTIYPRVFRESPVYNKGTESSETYKKLMNTYGKPSNDTLRADLQIGHDHTEKNIVIELKCESATMTRLAADAHSKGKENTKIALAVAQDTLKLLLGFRPDAKVTRACVFAILTSEIVAIQMDGWIHGLNNQAEGRSKRVDGKNIYLFMWSVGVDAQGHWEDATDAPGILRYFSENASTIIPVLEKSKDELGKSET